MSAEFFEAIYAGDIVEVGRMLAEDPQLVHAEDDQGLSPILAAAYHGHTDLADLLANRKVLLTIFEAAATGKVTQIIRLLAKRPDLVSAYSHDGFQPLGLAAFFGHKEAVEYLIRAGAPVNAASQNETRVMPLHSAAARRHVTIASVLIEHGADTNARQAGGFTPLHSAAQNGDLPMIQLLLFNASDLKAETDDGKRPVDLAVAAGHQSAEKLLKKEITKRFRKTNS